MNIILFHQTEVELPLTRSDNRARHLLTILHCTTGDTFDAGIINGPRGKGTLTAITAESLRFSFAWAAEPPPLPPVHLLIGLPRPQTARDILRETTALGVASLRFVQTEKSEPGYARSSLWRTNEWQTHLINGAAQAFCTRLPVVTHHESLASAIGDLPAHAQGVAMDNYESPVALGQWPLPSDRPLVLALGAERGWSAGEREALRSAGFAFAHLGPRVLRTETACIAALAILKAKLGLL